VLSSVNAEVLAANAAFYSAFESGALGPMSAVWNHSDQVICTHPGTPTTHGWDEVCQSWAQILRHDNGLQFIVTDERVVVRGEVGWVTCTENIIGPEGPRGTVAALNLFVRAGNGEWQMVAHHGGGVATRR
jgi:ketosteroid isomerase-like protein